MKEKKVKSYLKTVASEELQKEVELELKKETEEKSVAELLEDE